MSRRKLHGTDKTISYQDDDRMKKILAGVEQGVSCEFDNADRITAACTRVCPATLSGSEISCHCRARLLH